MYAHFPFLPDRADTPGWKTVPNQKGMPTKGRCRTIRTLVSVEQMEAVV